MMVDNKSTNPLEAFRTNAEQRRLEEPKALSSGIKKPVTSKRRKAKNAMIKLYVNGALLLISASLVFVAYRLAVLPQIFPPEVSAKKEQAPATNLTSQDFQGAANFARNFAYNWLAGDLKLASGYAAKNFQFPENVMSAQKRTVNWYLIWNVIPKSKNAATVVIQAQVKGPTDKAPKVVYLSVPVAIENGKYGVTDVPTYLPAPGRATYTAQQLQEISLPESDQSAITNVLNLFLSEYFGGNPLKTGTYFADGKNRAIIEGGKLNGIPEVTMYEVQKNNKNKVLVHITANVTIDNITMLQKFQFRVVKTNNRWYIESTEPGLPLYAPVNNQNQSNQ